VFSDRRDDGSDVSEDLRALEGAERGIDETLRVSFCTQPEQTPCPVFRHHKARSKPLGLLNVFGDVVTAARMDPYAGYGGCIVRRTITLNHWLYLIKSKQQRLHTTFYTPMRHIFGENGRFGGLH
jgi:hypothetical protein